MSPKTLLVRDPILSSLGALRRPLLIKLTSWQENFIYSLNIHPLPRPAAPSHNDNTDRPIHHSIFAARHAGPVIASRFNGFD